MSEPISGAASAGVAGWKFIGGLAGFGVLGASLAAVVVMCLTPPRNQREWTVGLISTVIGSIGGGSAVIQHFELQSWAHSPYGLIAMLGLVFACGLPAWALVRWLFNGIAKRDAEKADLMDIAREMKEKL